MGNHLVAHLSFCFFIVYTEVNAYVSMKYLLKIDDNFISFEKKWLRNLLTTSILMRRYVAVQK